MHGLKPPQNIDEYPGGLVKGVDLIGLFGHVDSKIPTVAKLNYDVNIFVVLLRIMEPDYVLAFYLFHDFYFVIDILSGVGVQFFLIDFLDCPLVPLLVSHQVDFAESSPPDFPNNFINS